MLRTFLNSCCAFHTSLQIKIKQYLPLNYRPSFMPIKIPANNMSFFWRHIPGELEVFVEVAVVKYQTNHTKFLRRDNFLVVSGISSICRIRAVVTPVKILTANQPHNLIIPIIVSLTSVSNSTLAKFIFSLSN